MNKALSAELRRYYKDISASIVCSVKQKKSFIAELDSCIKEFTADNPECTIDDIRAQFGTTEEISRGFMENTSPAHVKKKLNVKRAVIFALAAALIIWLAFAVISLVDVHREAHGTLREGILYISTFVRFTL